MDFNGSIKVGYVLKRYPRYSETFVVNEILAHEKSGMEIEIFSLRSPSDPYYQNILSKVRSPVTYISNQPVKTSVFWDVFRNALNDDPDLSTKLNITVEEDFLEFYQAILLAQEIRNKKIQHLHAHFATVATSVARLAAIFTGIPYTFTAHAKDIYHDYVKPEDMKRKISDAAHVVTVSDFNVDYLQNTFGADRAKVDRVYNGLDLKRFRYQAPKERPATILAVGRLVEKKGFDVLINACSILLKNEVPFHCKIVGEGELESNLRDQIQRLNLQDNVELPGPFPQNELVNLVQNSAIFAAPCIIGTDGNRDGLPTVLLESMALGTPCVSTDVTGIPEMIQNEETGLLVSQGDSDSLASALERLIENSDLGIQLAQQARKLIEAKFDIHKNAAQIRSHIKNSVLAKMNDLETV